MLLKAQICPDRVGCCGRADKCTRTQAPVFLFGFDLGSSARFVLQMGLKAVGLVSCVILVKEPTALVPGSMICSILCTAPCKLLHVLHTCTSSLKAKSHCSNNDNDNDHDAKRMHPVGCMSVWVFCVEQINQ